MFSRRRETSLIPNYLILLLLVAFAVGPLVVLGFNSVKDSTEIAANPLGPPSEIHLENFANAWVQGNFAKTVRNSAILVVFTVIADSLPAVQIVATDPPQAAEPGEQQRLIAVHL